MNLICSELREGQYSPSLSLVHKEKGFLSYSRPLPSGVIIDISNNRAANIPRIRTKKGKGVRLVGFKSVCSC